MAADGPERFTVQTSTMRELAAALGSPSLAPTDMLTAVHARKLQGGDGAPAEVGRLREEVAELRRQLERGGVEAERRQRLAAAREQIAREDAAEREALHRELAAAFGLGPEELL